MTDLSPAAQDIVNAAVEAGGGYGCATPVLHARLAAALRAAVGSDVYKANLNDELEVMFSEGWNSLRKEILAIANELTNQ